MRHLPLLLFLDTYIKQHKNISRFLEKPRIMERNEYAVFSYCLLLEKLLEDKLIVFILQQSLHPFT